MGGPPGLETLKPGKEIFITIDWAMKWLPISGRESQQDFYGKRGISWHVIHVMWRPFQNMPFQARVYVHVFDQSKQNGGDVNAILIHFLQQFHQELPNVETAFIRSDNGPHYHQSTLMASIHSISEKTGIFIKWWSFSEAQSGKGACDRSAAVVKNHLHRYIAERHKVTNAHEFVTGATSEGSPRGFTFYAGQVHGHSDSSDADAPESPKRKKLKIERTTAKTKRVRIPGISAFHDFEFSVGDNGRKHIKAWKHYGIGDGVLIDEKYWVNNEYETTFQPLVVGEPRPEQWNMFGDLPDEDGQPVLGEEEEAAHSDVEQACSGGDIVQPTEQTKADEETQYENIAM